MTKDEIETLANEFFAAIERGQVDEIRAMYAPDALIWHNNDDVEQPVEQNLQVLAWLVSRLRDRRYEEVRRVIVDDGFIQQHVLRGEGPGGRLSMPAMMRVFTADGKITRIEEYIDPAGAAVLTTRR